MHRSHTFFFKSKNVKSITDVSLSKNKPFASIFKIEQKQHRTEEVKTEISKKTVHSIKSSPVPTQVSQQQQQVSSENDIYLSPELIAQGLICPAWLEKALVDNKERNKGVPLEIARLNELVTKRLLHDYDTFSSDTWNLVGNDEKKGFKTYVKKSGVEGFHQNGCANQNRDVIWSEMEVPCNFRQFLSLMWTNERSYQYKPDVVECRNMHMYNVNHYVTYMMMKAIWPTSGRDLVYTGQYRVIPERKNLIVNSSFSYAPILERDFSPLVENAVRAHVDYGGMLVEPHNGNTCKVIRIMAMDMGGNIPAPIERFVEKKSAYVLFHMSESLQKHEPTPPPRLTHEGGGNVDDLGVSKDVSYYIPSITKLLGVPLKKDVKFDKKKLVLHKNDQAQHQQADGPPSSSKIERLEGYKRVSLRVIVTFFLIPMIAWLVSNDTSGREFSSKLSLFVLGTLLTLLVVDSITKKIPGNLSKNSQQHHGIGTYVSEVVLVFILPPASWDFANMFYPKGREVVFFVIFAVMLRSLVTAIIGAPMLHADGRKVRIDGMITGAVTCRVDVDIRRTLKFIRNERLKNRNAHNYAEPESIITDDSKIMQAKVSVSHVVVRAIAIAMSETPQLNGRKVRMPFLGLNGWFSNCTIDISLVRQASSNSEGRNGCSRTSSDDKKIVKLANIKQLSVQDIANHALFEAEHIPEHGNDSSILKMIQTPFQNLAAALDMPTPFSPQNGRQLGSCVVLTTPGALLNNSSLDKDKVDALSITTMNAIATIFVVIGGVRVIRNADNLKLHIVSLHVVIDCPACSVQNCESFVERVKNLVQSTNEL